MKATWAKRARLDLAEIFDYIAIDNSNAATGWTDRLIARADTVASMKNSGRVVPELMREDIREIIVATYRVVYRVLPVGIRVLTVFEGHQQFPDDLDPDAT